MNYNSRYQPRRNWVLGSSLHTARMPLAGMTGHVESESCSETPSHRPLPLKNCSAESSRSDHQQEDFVLAVPRHMEFLGQGSDPRRSCDIHWSCGNARSLTHYAGPGIEPASQCSRDILIPLRHSRDLCRRASEPGPEPRVSEKTAPQTLGPRI